MVVHYLDCLEDDFALMAAMVLMFYTRWQDCSFLCADKRRAQKSCIPMNFFYHNKFKYNYSTMKTKI